MKKRFTSVSEVVNQFIDDESFCERFEQEIGDKGLAKSLFVLRSRAGKTQEEMAGLIGCTPEDIARFENSSNDAIDPTVLSLYVAAIQPTIATAR